jgi:hypothetical protein
MSLSDLEQHVLAYYLEGAADDLNLAGRFYPHAELVLIVGDKIEVATRRFGRKVRSQTRAPATAFVDRMIADGAFSTKQNDFGGTMHQFQAPAYKQALRAWQADDPILREAQGGGEGFWPDRFAALAG